MNYIEKFMKDNDLKFNEGFYLLDEDDEKVYDFPFVFIENYELKKENDSIYYTYELANVLSEKYKIEKIQHEPKTIWDLTEEDMYYYINTCGEIESTYYDDDEFMDGSIVEIGNGFLTEEEAEFEVERRKCEAILLKYGSRDIISIGDKNTLKYFIRYKNSEEYFLISSIYDLQTQGTIYFESEEMAQKAIEETGEYRLKKYVFNVKE